MINPFINESEIKRMKELDTVDYVVVYPESINQFNFIGFSDRDKAYNRAVEISESGLWAYVIELTDDHIIAYLTGWCNKK